MSSMLGILTSIHQAIVSPQKTFVGKSWALVRLACEQVDELASLRRSAAQLKHPELRLRYQRAVQESEKALLQTVSALGFTPTARAKLGLVVAQAAETQTRLGRFTGRQGRPPSA